MEKDDPLKDSLDLALAEAKRLNGLAELLSARIERTQALIAMGRDDDAREMVMPIHDVLGRVTKAVIAVSSSLDGGR